MSNAAALAAAAAACCFLSSSPSWPLSLRHAQKQLQLQLQRSYRCYAFAASTTPTPAGCRPTTATGRPARRLLIVGDGDFSFSRAILPLLPPTTEQVVTTCLHPNPDELVARYPAAPANLDTLSTAKRVEVGFGVDATDLAGTLFRGGEAAGDMNFERIMWNFPHVVGKANVAGNRELLKVCKAVGLTSM